RCIVVQKHKVSFTKILQLNKDRLISISKDGLICCWRIDSYRPQCLQRINDRTNEVLFDPNLKKELNQKLKKLDIRCIYQVKTGDFIAGVGIGFIIFDSSFNVRIAVRNAHNETIIAITT